MALWVSGLRWLLHKKKSSLLHPVKSRKEKNLGLWVLSQEQKRKVTLPLMQQSVNGFALFIAKCAMFSGQWPTSVQRITLYINFSRFHTGLPVCRREMSEKLLHQLIAAGFLQKNLKVSGKQKAFLRDAFVSHEAKTICWWSFRPVAPQWELTWRITASGAIHCGFKTKDKTIPRKWGLEKSLRG